MEWQQVDRYRWEVAEAGFQGQALLRETNNGFIASINVENTDFDMEMLNDREFFEKKQDAVAFLQQKMQKTSY